jgi:hypothetical protein
VTSTNSRCRGVRSRNVGASIRQPAEPISTDRYTKGDGCTTDERPEIGAGPEVLISRNKNGEPSSDEAGVWVKMTIKWVSRSTPQGAHMRAKFFVIGRHRQNRLPLVVRCRA